MESILQWFEHAVVTILLLLCLAGAIDYFKGSAHVVVTYDCRIAEISPDYPLEVKQECREMLRGFAQ